MKMVNAARIIPKGRLTSKYVPRLMKAVPKKEIAPSGKPKNPEVSLGLARTPEVSLGLTRKMMGAEFAGIESIIGPQNALELVRSFGGPREITDSKMIWLVRNEAVKKALGVVLGRQVLKAAPAENIINLIEKYGGKKTFADEWAKMMVAHGRNLKQVLHHMEIAEPRGGKPTGSRDIVGKPLGRMRV